MGSRAAFNGVQAVRIEPDAFMYTAGLSNNTPAATPTDVAFLQGVASKEVRIYRITIAVGATASGAVIYDIVKRVGGTQTVADTPFLATTHSAQTDSADPVSAVIVSAQSGVYTSNRTIGTLAGVYASYGLTILANAGQVFEYKPASPIILRGITQSCCINGASHTLLTAEKFSVSFEWSEV